MKRLSAQQYAAALIAAWTEAAPAQRPIVLKKFVQSLRRRRAVKLLPRILDHLERLLDAQSGVTRVRAWSAARLDQASLAARLSEALGPSVITSAVQPALMGGLRLRIGDQLIDGTIRQRLQRLQTHLSL